MISSKCWILASDIDNTLTGDTQALQRLAVRLAAEQSRGTLFLILSTGRRLDQVVQGFIEEHIPKPDAIISQVGTEIHLPPFDLESIPLPEWNALLRQQFSRNEAMSFLSDIEGLEMQPAEYNTPLKVSCYLDRTRDPDAVAMLIGRRIVEARQDEVFQVVWSSGRDLDIIPFAAGKGKAIDFLIQFLELSPQTVVVAGDSGNDLSMFKTFEFGIVVANAQPELREELAQSPKAGIYFAQRPYAAGVEEGLQNLRLLP